MIEPSILLKTNFMLDKNQEEEFLYTVEKYAPEGIIKDRKIKKAKSAKTFYYTIYLTRNLIQSEAEFIVYAWDNVFKENYDIEITYNEIEKSNIEIEYLIDDTTHKHIVDIASRFLHNRWVDHKISNGWRYGLYYNIKNKTDPKIRDWDSLLPEYRKNIEFTKEDAISFYKQNKNLFT